jgi:hypothetical protein
MAGFLEAFPSDCGESDRGVWDSLDFDDWDGEMVMLEPMMLLRTKAILLLELRAQAAALGTLPPESHHLLYYLVVGESSLRMAKLLILS